MLRVHNFHPPVVSPVIPAPHAPHLLSRAAVFQLSWALGLAVALLLGTSFT